jgi:putative ABC transport system substrate-binding protein
MRAFRTQWSGVKENIFFFALCAVLFALCSFAEAQQPKKMARIGYLSPLSGPSRALEVFKEGLWELGWAEGKQIEFEYRYARGNVDKLSEFATELVRLKVDVIVAGPAFVAANAAKHATTTIPIVMVAVGDPVSTGLVATLARPGANITGLTLDVTREQAGKNLELLKEAVPKVSRVAILRGPHVLTQIPYGKEADRAAKILGVTIQFVEMQARNDKSLEDAFGAIVQQRSNALLLTPNSFFADRREQIINFAARRKLPAIYPGQSFVGDGGLMSYGANPQDLWRRAAIYVDKILTGTKPADLPVEQPKKFEFVINLKTAKQIGVTIPQSVLFRADRVIR